MVHIKIIVAGLLVFFSAISYQKDLPETVPKSHAPDFGHALSLYDSGDYEAAAAEAALLASSGTDRKWKARAGYLAGRAYASMGETEKAVESFDAALKTLPEMRPYAFFKLGKGYEKAGDKQAAADAFAKVFEGYPESDLASGALMNAGRLYFDLGIYRKAAMTLTDLLRERPDRDTRGKAHYLLMSSYAALGASDSAYFHYMALWKMHPASDEMDDAQTLLEKMVRAGYEPEEPDVDERLERASGFGDYGKYMESAVEYKMAFDAMKESDVRAPSALLEAGMSYFRARKNSQAVVMFRKVASLYPDARETPSALYWLARTYLRMGDGHSLELTVAKMEELFPNHPNTPLALYYYGSELIEEEEFGKAAEVLRRVPDSHPTSSVVDDALWKLGWAEYLSGGYDSSAKVFGELADRYPGAIYEAGGDYWRARAMSRAGDKDTGGKELKRISDGYKLSYYGWAAAGDGSRFLMEKSKRPPTAGDMPGPEASYDDRNLALAYELGLQRMRDDAIAVLRKEERRYGATVKGIRMLAGLYAMVDEYRRPLELASSHYESQMDSGRSTVPDEAMELIFPAGYWEVIWAESRKYDVDPFLVASLIREESHFDPRAVSPAGAVGLMQMMPSTAAEVCRKLEMSPPGKDDLKDGSYNVPLGVCHLSYLVQKHEGRLVYVLAEYNAGPGALKRWEESMPDVPDDEFVERIGYRETRNYIKRVLRNYYVYRELYGS